jgi:hypothetical protein
VHPPRCEVRRFLLGSSPSFSTRYALPPWSSLVHSGSNCDLPPRHDPAAAFVELTGIDYGCVLALLASRVVVYGVVLCVVRELSFRTSALSTKQVTACLACFRLLCLETTPRLSRTFELSCRSQVSTFKLSCRSQVSIFELNCRSQVLTFLTQ